MRNLSLLLWVLLLVDGVFGVDKVKQVSVSVMKGDSVTLHTDVTELQSDDKIEWMSEDNVIIAQIANNKISIDDVSEGRLELDHQTGSLTIRNITENRIYNLDIGGRIQISKRFNVTVHDEMKTVSVKKEDSIILRTGVLNIQEYYQILWKFEDERMAEITKGTNKFSLYNSANGRFSGRLHPDHQTGSLTISDSQTTDSGDYHLNMSSSSHTIQRTISVTVKGLSSAVIAVIALSVALVVAVAVAVGVPICYKQHIKNQSRGVN